MLKNRQECFPYLLVVCSLNPAVVAAEAIHGSECCPVERVTDRGHTIETATHAFVNTDSVIFNAVETRHRLV